MKFGASSWPFQWEPPYEDCIKRVAGLGFKAIELIGWNADYLKDYYTPQKIKDLRGCLDSEGLMISQFVHTPHDLSHPDKAKRDAAIADWKRAVEIGSELGSKLINMVLEPSLRDARHRRDPAHHHQAAGADVRDPRHPGRCRLGPELRGLRRGAARMRRRLRRGRHHDDGRAAPRALPRQPRRRAPAARARRQPGDGDQLRPVAHLPDGRLPEHHRSTG